jgi:hypothetical protein
MKNYTQLWAGNIEKKRERALRMLGCLDTHSMKILEEEEALTAALAKLW